MIQISNKVFCDKNLKKLQIDSKLLPNPYYDYPFMIIQNFLDTPRCNQIADTIYNNSNYKKALVKSMLLKSVVDSSLNEKIRKTKIYDLPSFYKNLYQEAFLKHKNSIEKFFNIALTLATDIQVLEYTKGSFYIKHSDDSSEIIDKNGNTIGFKCIAHQRKITTVLFATSNSTKILDNHLFFIGGELIFNYLYDEFGKNIKISPKAGDMVVFPSNSYFSHEVKEVKEGYRLSLVQWHNGIVY